MLANALTQQRKTTTARRNARRSSVFGNALGNAAVRGIQNWQSNRTSPGENSEMAGGLGGLAESGSSDSATVSFEPGSNGDVPRSNAIDANATGTSTGLSRSERIARLNRLFDQSTKIGPSVSDSELRSLEKTYATDLGDIGKKSATTLAAVEVIGRKEVAASWMNAYGMDSMSNAAWRMSAVHNAPPAKVPYFGRPPAWIGHGNSVKTGANGGVTAMTYLGAGLTATDVTATTLEKTLHSQQIGKVGTRAAHIGLFLEGGELLADSLSNEEIDKGDAGHFGVSLGAYGAVAINPELWMPAAIFGIADAGLQFNEYEIKYTANGYKAGGIVTGWKSVFVAPGLDTREGAMLKIMTSQHVDRPAAEKIYGYMKYPEAERQRILTRARWH